MKLNYIFLIILLIALIGCENTNTNDNNKNDSYDINSSGEKIKSSIENMYAPMRLNAIRNQNSFNESNQPISRTDNSDELDKNTTQTNNDEPEDEYIPNTPSEDDEKDSNFLSTYSTKILTNDSNRYNNIEIVSKRLNEVTLQPGESFSFNDICGPYGKSDGFLEATILLSDGTESKGYGGGVCQLSSTLYNAIKTLNVDITERHHHSTPVAYVPKNEDATVSLQSGLDFKFTNRYDVPIKFTTACEPKKLTVSVWKA